MSLKLYNSMSREEETFKPISAENVTMYVCGPTVYDTPHLGNARPAVVFDVLYRLLKHLYPSVEYARNFTDIDDKIMDRAKENGESIADVARRSIDNYHRMTDALNIRQPDYEPLATGNILPMRGQIAELLMAGYAYEAEGHVLFDTVKWPSHGKLSGHAREDLDTGSRVAVARYKRNPTDFVLWKPSAEDQPGWDSLWGRGRPGWHIECSAMIANTFADQTIDIHGGGQDLRFPHHECEISQFEASHDGRALANYWLHNAMVRVNGAKMAKSTGNFVTVEDALQTHTGAVIRLALLMAHYRSPLDWNERLLVQSSRTVTGWHRALQGIRDEAEVNGYAEHVLSALYDDLNTPLAIARLHALAGELTDFDSDLREDWRGVARGMRYAAEIMGFDLSQAGNEQYLRGTPQVAEIERLLGERQEARKRKDYAESDRLRGVLNDMGVLVEDGPQGATWRLQ